MIIRKNYKSKLLLILFLFFSLYAVIVVRLFFVQIYQRNFFKLLAKQQYATEITTQPPRALIYDCNHVPLTLNRERLSAFILPHRLHQPKKTMALIQKKFPDVYKKLMKKKNSKRRFLWLKRHLSDDLLKEVKSYDSPDIYYLAEPERFYPFDTMGHIIGFTDVDNIGIAGFELQFNNHLGGTPTTFILEKDARSNYFYFRKDIKELGEKGKNVTLTLDRNLQFFAYESLKETVEKFQAKGGGALIVEPATGQILAMASAPGFDPNNVEDIEATKNIPVTECFELGSVIKVFTALAALEEGVVTPDEEIDCEGKATYIDGFRVENWKSLGPGTHPFWQVVSRSNNVGIAKIAKRLGPKLYHHLQKLGFGQLVGVRFPGERAGFVNPPRNWSRSSLIVLSFGYEIMATLLQLARAFSIIANGGQNVQPYMVSKPERKQAPLQRKFLYKKETIDQIKDILEFKDWIKKTYAIKGYRMMGKTGTARSVKDGLYSTKDHVYTYAGIVEKGNYRRVIITFIKEPQKRDAQSRWSSQITLPLFHKIAQKMIVYDLGQGSL